MDELSLAATIDEDNESKMAPWSPRARDWGSMVAGEGWRCGVFYLDREFATIFPWLCHPQPSGSPMSSSLGENAGRERVIMERQNETQIEYALSYKNMYIPFIIILLVIDLSSWLTSFLVPAHNSSFSL